MADPETLRVSTRRPTGVTLGQGDLKVGTFKGTQKLSGPGSVRWVLLPSSVCYVVAGFQQQLWKGAEGHLLCCTEGTFSRGDLGVNPLWGLCGGPRTSLFLIEEGSPQGKTVRALLLRGTSMLR